MFGFQEIKIQQAQRVAGQQLVQGRRAILVAVHVSFVGRSSWFVVSPLLLCLIVAAAAFPLAGLFPVGVLFPLLSLVFGDVGLHARDCLFPVGVLFPLLFLVFGDVGLHARDYFQVLGIKHVLRSAVFDFIAQRFGDPRGAQNSQSHFSQGTIARDHHFVGVLF